MVWAKRLFGSKHCAMGKEHSHRPGYSDPHPAWPQTLPTMGNPQPPCTCEKFLSRFLVSPLEVLAGALEVSLEPFLFQADQSQKLSACCRRGSPGLWSVWWLTSGLIPAGQCRSYVGGPRAEHSTSTSSELGELIAPSLQCQLWTAGIETPSGLQLFWSTVFHFSTNTAI